MNRRSLFKAAIGACAAVAVPWKQSHAEIGEAKKTAELDDILRLGRRQLRHARQAGHEPLLVCLGKRERRIIQRDGEFANPVNFGRVPIEWTDRECEVTVVTVNVGAKVDQVERIKRLLEIEEQRDREAMRDLLPKLEEARARWATPGSADGAIKTVTYCSTVERHLMPVRNCCPEGIDIWWDEREPDEFGLYGCGLVCLSNELAASMDDKKLTKHLMTAFLVAITPPYGCRQGLFGPFTGKPLWIRNGEVIGVDICGDINTLGGLSKT